jgi:hypothetical protein
MRAYKTIIATLGVLGVLAAYTPVRADEDGYSHGWNRHEQREHHERAWQDHERHERRWGGYARRPTYYAPPTTYYRAAPPPHAYGGQWRQ